MQKYIHILGVFKFKMCSKKIEIEKKKIIRKKNNKRLKQKQVSNFLHYYCFRKIKNENIMSKSMPSYNALVKSKTFKIISDN